MLKIFVPETDFSSYDQFCEQFRIVIPEAFNFAYDVVDHIASKTPDRLALLWCNEQGEEKQISFTEMRQQSNRVANIFRDLGIGKGDRVMLVLKRRVEFWYCLLALHRLGAISIPATHMLTEKDIAYRNEAAGICMIVAIDENRICENIEKSRRPADSIRHLVILGQKRNGWVDLNTELSGASHEFPRPQGDGRTHNNDISLVYFTSGTTGMPKMVQHDFTYPLSHIITAKYWQRVKNGGLHLTLADTGWAKAVWGKIYGQWLCGSAVMVYDYDRFIPGKLLSILEKYRVTTFCAPPTVYRFLIKDDVSKYNLSALKHCTIAGEPLNPQIYNQWLDQTGIKLAEGYGQTETTLVVGNFPWMKIKPGSMGCPSPGYDIDIIDADGKQCSIDQPGQIVIRINRNIPTGMFRGYYQNRSLTSRIWHDGCYFTGDMASRDADGYLWFIGRADDVIKSAGYRIGPFEVEKALLDHPAVQECVVTGAPDAMRGQIVKATVVLTQGYSGNTKLMHELQDHVRHTTAYYKYPRIIVFVDELPKTISGKILRIRSGVGFGNKN